MLEPVPRFVRCAEGIVENKEGGGHKRRHLRGYVTEDGEGVQT